MSAIQSLTGIFFSPRQTARALAERPSWVTAFVIGAVIFAVVTYLLYPIQAREGAEKIRDSFFGRNMTEEQLRQAEDRAANPGTGLRIGQGVVAPVVALLLLLIVVYGAIVNVIAKLLGGQGSFKGTMALVAHSRLISPVLASLVALPICLAKKSVLGVSLSLAALFPGLDPGGWGYGLLSMFSVFGIWFLIALVIGVEEVHRIPRGRALAAAGIPWLAGGFLTAAMQSIF